MVKMILAQAMESIKKEQPAEDTRQQQMHCTHGASSTGEHVCVHVCVCVCARARVCMCVCVCCVCTRYLNIPDLDAESSVHPESAVPSGYSSSSEEGTHNGSEDEDAQGAADELSSGDRSSEPQ